MGINMDIKTKPDFKFINLDGLDESVKSELHAILKSEIASDVLKLPWDNGEKHYNSNSMLPMIQQEIPDHWQSYESENNYGISETTTSMLTPQISGIAYTTCPVMQVQYQDWPMSNAYTNSAPGEPHAYSYVSSVAYTSPMYPSSVNEVITTSSPSRDNEKRTGRGRNRKSQNYNRIANTSDMQSSYLIQQGQFNQVPTMCHPGLSYIPYVSSQQHPAAGRPIFMPPPHHTQYTSPRIHHNGHPQQYPHPLPSNYSQHQVSSAVKHHQRQLTQTYTSIYNQDKSLTQRHLQKDNDKISDSPRSTASDSSCQVSYNKDKDNGNNNNIDNNYNTNNIGEDNSNMPDSNNHDTGKSNDNTTHGTRELLNKYSTAKSPIEIKDAITNGHLDNQNLDDHRMTFVMGDDKDDANIKLEDETVEIEGPLTNVECMASPSSTIAGAPTDQYEENIRFTRDESGTKSTKAAGRTCTSPILALKTFASILKSTSDTKNSSGFVEIPSPCKLSSEHFDGCDNLNSIQMRAGNQQNKVDVIKKQQIEAVTTAERDSTKISVSALLEDKNSHTEHASKFLNDPNIYRMGEFLLNYRMDRKTISLLPRGLTNRSNYCYINSILQALLACPPFYNLLRALSCSRHSSKNSSTPLIDSMVKFVDEFSPLPEGERLPRKDRGHKRTDETAVDIKGGNAFEPSYVYTMLKNTSSPGVFSIEGRQEDAEEFLSCLLNGISDEMLELMKKVNENSQNLEKTEDTNFNCNSGDEEWKVMGPKNKGSITRCTEFARTPLSDIFRGQLRSRILRQGDQSTDNVQPFFTLQLDIEKADSVKAALEILVGKDQVEGMTCSKTKQQIQAWKQVTLEELPVILILHLKWFDYKLDGCSKIFKTVSYAIDLKIDAKFLSPNATKKLTAKQKQYKLFAVTYHDGKETTKGHYVTDAFHVGFGAWVRYDDSSVKGICEGDVLNPSPPRVPYLLYYRRCDTIGNNQLSNTRPC